MADLTLASRFYQDRLRLQRSESGALPKALALRLGQRALINAPWLGLQSPSAASRLRLIEAVGPAPLPARGWGAMIWHMPGLPTPDDSGESLHRDPDGHCLRHIESATGQPELAAICLNALDIGASSAFYQGLLGGQSHSVGLRQRLQLSAGRAIDIAHGADPTPAPLSVRFRRVGTAAKAIAKLTELPRCLSGPQDEIIELI